MKISEHLDYLMLGITSFYMAETVDGIVKPNLSLLWLYFTTPELRAVLYSGFATTLLYHSSFTSPKLSLFATAGALYITSYISLFKPDFRLYPKRVKQKDGTWITEDIKGRPTKERRNWTQQASSDLGWMGAWWIGAGNGDWYGFIGHNGTSDTTILPAAFLEQMSVSRDPSDINDIDIEELNESSDDIKMDEI